ncbi:MAG TPA: TonB-dependent receptor [Blastocatellia bacterium]|nr:TonB-dependent receptor [Blastocatellia bacterium]
MKTPTLGRMVFAMLWLVSTSFGNTFNAQDTRGTLRGTVSDATGGAILAAVVTVTNNATGEEFGARTDAQGSFVLPSLPPGQYTAKVEASGFKRGTLAAISIEVGTPAKVNITLEVGEVTEEVTVTSNAQEVVNTVSPVLSNTINTKQVTDLPLLGRNPLDLARLQAGIQVTGTDIRNSSVGGLRGSATTVTHDGINAMDNFVKTSSFFAISAPSLNATSEFSVTVGTVGSDAGRGVAQVRIVTPSGSNDIHGSAFWQHRNDNLNANDFFNNATGIERERELQNFFGFAVGGPVTIPKVYDGRNRSFWFFSYEGFREPFSVTRNRTVLTPDARRGIFRYIGANGQLTSVNLLSIGTVSSLNPVTTAQLNAMPEPNNTLAGDGLNTAGFSYNVSGSDPNDKFSIRADQKLFDSEKLGSHKLEWVLHRATFLLTPDTFNGLEARFPGLGDDAEQSSTRWLTAAAIHSTFGARATNEVRFGHQRSPVGFLRKGPPDSAFYINLGSVTDFQNTFMSQGRNTMVYQTQDNFSMVTGTHTLKMGVDIQSLTAITFNDAGIHPTVNIGTNSANPDGIVNADFANLPAGAAGNTIVGRARSIFRDLVGLLGSANATFNVVSPTSGFVPGATRSRPFKYRDASFYFQDQWRMKRNFTLSLGLRYDYIGVPYVPNGLAILPQGGVGALFGISGPGNVFNPGSLKGTSPTTIDFVSGNTGKPLYNKDWNNFAPFVGFAYSPSFESGPMHWLLGDAGKSSIRAGYSISYLRDGFTVVSNALGTGTTNPGLIQTAAETTPTGVLTTSGVPLVTPVFKMPVTDAENFAVNPNNGLWTFDPNLKTPYVQQWSFGIEREIAPNTAFEIRYVGNHAIKVLRAIDYNEVNIFENGFLREFLNAQLNLAARGGTSFAPGPAGTVPLPILSTLFAGLSSGSGFSNSTFIANLNDGNVGAMASTLAGSTTYSNNRRNLTPNFFRVNQNAAFARVLGNFAFSNYHSLQMEIRRRFSHGLQFQANYTWAKALTDSNGSQSTLESYRTLRHFGLDKARSDQDQTHRFVANGIYDLPIGAGRRYLSDTPVLRKVLEGWTVGSIVTWQGRPPFYITSNRSTFNSFNPGANPAQLVGISFDEFKKSLGVFRTPAGLFFINPKLLDIVTDPATGNLISSRLKPGLLGAPAPGTFGNFPINSLNGPRFFQTDFSLVKRTYFSERGNVEFRVTFYNALNNANFVFGSQNFDDETFGQITSTSGTPRIVHFQLAVNW